MIADYHLKSFRKDRVVREEERVSDKLPGLIPGKVFLVDEDTHKLRDGERWMSLLQNQDFGSKFRTLYASNATHVIELNSNICGTQESGYFRTRYAILEDNKCTYNLGTLGWVCRCS